MKHTTPFSTKPGGFTLVELLVAMSLLAIIGILGYRGLNNLSLAHAHNQAIQSAWLACSRTGDRLGTDIRQALHPAHWDEAPGQRTIEFRLRQENGFAELSFTRGASGDEGARHVTYLWQAANGGELWLYYHSRQAGSSRPASQRLLAPVPVLEISVLDAQGIWQRQWPPGSRPDLPRAVRIQLALPDGNMVERIFDVPSAQ